MDSTNPETKFQQPEIIGHRGFRSSYPENTMLGFKEGIKAGATTVEADIQLAADGIVVISHDMNTSRCFGLSMNVESTPYNNGLDVLRTNDKYAEKMPTLKDVCEFIMNDPLAKNVKLMIDIKLSNTPAIVPRVIQVLEDVAPLEAWQSKCVLGVWREPVMTKVIEVAPQLDVVFIGFQHRLAQKFLEYEQVKGISLNYAAWTIYGGPKLMEDARKKGAKIYAWTVNDPDHMKWAIASRIDGIITDHPDVFKTFIDTLDAKDFYSDFFTSNPAKFYGWKDFFSHYATYSAANVALFLGDNVPGLFKKI